MNKNQKEEYIEILREGYGNLNNRLFLTKKFEIKNPVCIYKYVTKIQARNIENNLDNFFMKNQIEFIAYKNEIPEMEQFNTDINTYKNVYSDYGMFLITPENKTQKFLLKMVNYRYERDCKLEIIVSKNNIENTKNIIEKFIEFSDKNSIYKNKVIDANIDFVKLEKYYNWDDVILPKKLKENIQKDLSMLFSNSKLFNKYNFSKGILLHGKPGTGKTQLAKILASLCKNKYTFIWITPDQLTKQNMVSFIYDLARNLKPSIIFLEDLDLIGQERNYNAYKEVLGSLLNEMSGIKDNSSIVTIATTNDLETIEKALKDRPGRFDIVYEFNLPELAERIEMLKLFIKDFKIEIEIKKVAEDLEGLTGAHIKELINQIIYESILNGDKIITIKDDYLITALKKVKKIKITPFVGFQTQIQQESDNED